MHRLAIVIGVSSVLLGAQAAFAAAPSGSRIHSQHRMLGVVRARNHAVKSYYYSNNLLYHAGGSVQTGTHHTYAIYWGPSSSFPDSGYQSLINRFFGDVAADSGKTSNVYYNDTQYYQTINGSTTHIAYSESFGGSWWDSSTPSSGCSNTSGGRLACVTDGQIQQEVVKAINANGWPTGPSNEYFVFLGNGISTCSGSSCFVSTFCAYHGSFSSSGATVLYANMPYTGYNLSACGSGQYPNNDPAADSTINVTSHEANETITDYLGNAWFDRRGYEIGDKCAWNFGNPLGSDGYGEYNQVIAGHDYYLQGEWSNHHSGCVWSNT